MRARMWLDVVPHDMKKKVKECGFCDPPHWHSMFTAESFKEGRPLAAFVYDESFSLDSELVGPLPSQTAASLKQHILQNKRGGMLALITAQPFVFQGFAPLCMTVSPQLEP